MFKCNDDDDCFYLRMEVGRGKRPVFSGELFLCKLDDLK